MQVAMCLLCFQIILHNSLFKVLVYKTLHLFHFFSLPSPEKRRFTPLSTPLVVRSLSSCCPVVVQSLTGQQLDNNWTTTGQRAEQVLINNGQSATSEYTIWEGFGNTESGRYFLVQKTPFSKKLCNFATPKIYTCTTHNALRICQTYLP